jgi:hypothetical protein
MGHWEQILIIGTGNMTFFALQIAYFRWKKRQEVPQELEKEIAQLRYDLVALRGQVKYIQGVLNGKHWKES